MIHRSPGPDRAPTPPSTRAIDRRSLTYLDAQADAQTYSRDALEASVEAFASVTDDPDADPVEIILAVDRLTAFTQELTRRDRVNRISTGTASGHDRSWDAWRDLARVVRERVETPDILILAGIPMRKTGASRGRDEWHGPCPVCGEGDDRLAAWSGPYGRLWCRRCEWSGDVISAASLIVKTGQFRDAVRFLAELAGLEGASGR